MTFGCPARWLVLTAALTLSGTAAEPGLPERIDLAMTAGNFAAARPLAEEWLATLRKQPDKKLESARVLHVLGSIRDRLGDHAEALQLLEEAASAYHAASASAQELAACADEAGRAALAAAKYSTAEQWLTKAITGRPPESVAASRCTLAELFLKTGRVDEARRTWERALTDAGMSAAARCLALRGLGVHAHTTGAWEQAVKHFRAAREVASGLGPDAPAMQAALDGQTGQSLLRMGRPEEAEPLLETAAAHFKGHAGSAEEKAGAWNNLAALWLDTGRAGEAAERLRTLLEAPDAAAFAASPQAIAPWLNLAAARQRSGDPDAAAALTRSETLAASHLPEVHPLRGQIALTAATLAADAGDQAQAKRKAAAASQTAVRLLDEAAAWPDESRLFEFHATLDPVSPLAALAPDDRDALAGAVLAAQGALPEILLGRRRWEARADAAAVLAWQRDPDKSPGPPVRRHQSAAALRASLPEKALLINFVRWRPHSGRGVWDAGGRYGALMLSRGEPARWVDLGPAAPIDNRLRRLIAAARDAVAAGSESASRSSIAWQLSSLYDQLWAPLELPAGRPRRLLLRADALLHFVPWAVLTDPSGATLCESFPDTEIIVFPRPRKAASLTPERPWRVLGAAVAPSDGLPDFREPLPAVLTTSLWQSLQEMPALPGVAAEAAAIHEAAGIRFAVETPEAIESAFAGPDKTGKRPSVIHFAGHGFACEDAAADGAGLLRAGLVLNDCAAALGDLANHRPRPVAADGLLFASDAAALPLDETALVVLSGCQTGLGHWHPGGQLAGLRHAFLIAGAGTVASTLWDLNDAAAPEMVRAIYAQLAGGTPPARAVWQAQRQWLKSADALRLTQGMRAAHAGAWMAESAGWSADW
jgi:CHAT domain-containing protein